jgi:L-arabinokinase
MTSSSFKTGEAPGRLDFMGGVADYSGSLVLEMPVQGTTRVGVRRITGNVFKLESDVHGSASFPWDKLQANFLNVDKASKARTALHKLKGPIWTHYVLGCLWIFSRAKQWTLDKPLEISVTSTVPEAMGVSSSAALEIATLRALALLSGHTFAGTELARLGQQAENQIVGAPCGLMDQLASAHGVPGHLIPILSRPDLLEEPVALPSGVIVVGWPSGVKHSVAESPYATARTAAFMGRKIVEAKLEKKFAHNSEVPLDWWNAHKEKVVPRSLNGAVFLERYPRVDDPLSEVVPGRIYPVRAALDFPIQENYRTHQAVELLRSLGPKTSSAKRKATLTQIGEFLFASHKAYSAMGLGSSETDRMVKAVKKLGPENGFYGARISGGGSGGTVAVLLEEKALSKLQGLTMSYCFTEQGPLPLIR